MKQCSNCGEPIYEDSNENPAETLGAIAEQSSSDVDVSCLCPVCKEQLGILSLMGFGE